MELTQTEENYLKALYHLTSEPDKQQEVSTTELSTYLSVKPASANEMLKKLKEKELVSYVKYGKISLTKHGQSKAIHIVRKHRIWETFLFQELKYKGNEVHEIAEQLEHIQSPDLTERLFKYLGSPKKDPHGETIPMPQDKYLIAQKIPLSKGKVNKSYIIMSVKDIGKSFMQYLDKNGLTIGEKLTITEKHDFDNALTIVVNEIAIHISEQTAQHIFVGLAAG